ncbi:hypothetical protein H632_c589p1 [Helicosporidium sp. ATCC 50920]|nr:hypothetical protein H632_c589p1 [Helicosporidium sp. ATCC 50920]|eukprot:KDD75618.1 hypothetical protein H632_c589p1 [Helicosporidium sp. ATCC 50920]
MQLKQLSKILVVFSPWKRSSASAREFLFQASSPKSRASNPSCDVSARLNLKQDPYVEITYENKKVEKIATGDLNVRKIVERIDSVAADMETEAILKGAGLHGQTIVSTWHSEIGREREVGERTNIDRVV